MFRRTAQLSRRLAPLALVLVVAPLAACDDADDADELDGAWGETGEEEARQEASMNEEPEPLCAVGESLPCSGDEVQFCDAFDGNADWGSCLVPSCEPGDTDSRSCGLGMGISQGGTCELRDGVPTMVWQEEACNTPLVLSFDEAPVEMRASAGTFDVSGAGRCTGTDWPTAATPWLAMDLDGNGEIDSGAELFGSGTVMTNGRHADNGFTALAPLDEDRDGYVGPSDPRFGDILVWRDVDGNKRSTPAELTRLADEGVTRIALEHAVLEQCDARGNCGRERSRFEFQGAGGTVRSGAVIDVYLACR